MKLDTLINLETDEDSISNLMKLRQDLLGAIAYEESSIKSLQNHEDFLFSPEVLAAEHVDRLCRTYFYTENKWYNAKIDSVDVDSQEADVSYIGYQNSYKVHAMFIKVIPKPNPENLEPGCYCEAIYKGDGHYYPCIIEKVSEEGYHVRFKKFNNREIVGLYYLRESRNNNNDVNKKKNFDDLTEFKVIFKIYFILFFQIPEHLKILPNDSEVQRVSKKKKIKKLKQAFKIQLIEKHSKEKQGKWTNFSDGGFKKKKGHFHNKKNIESIFKSPDTIEGRVGVMGSGKGMTNFNPRTRYSANDNSHLSRLF